MLPRAKKSFGQNFLQDASVLRKIVEAAEIVPGEAVLEIGPGTGALTQALVDAGARVIAVEADHDLIAPLHEKFGDRIELIEGDVLALDLTHTLSLTRRGVASAVSFKLVANIPYNITSPILERFLAHEPRPSRMVLMVQKEVADRMTAKPGEMGLLSVVCQLYAACKKACNVPRGAFRPIPKVDSAVVRLDLKANAQCPEPESVIKLAKAGFSHPRKQLHGNLAAGGFGTSERVKGALASAGLDARARAEALSVDEWVALAKALSVI